MNKIEITLDTTYSCPFSCPFCSTGDLARQSDMSIETAERCYAFLLQLISEYNLPCEVVIAGGEPLEDKKIGRIINIFSKLDNCTITLCTTGALRTDKKYWSDLASNGLKKVRLSLHSINENICKSIFGNGYDISVVIESINNILSSNISIDINYLVTALNKNCLFDVCKFMHEHNIQDIRILGLSKQGEAVKNWDALKTETDKSDLLTIRQICERFGLSPVFSGCGGMNNCTHTDENGNCLGGKTFFHINANGDIFRCPASKSHSFNMIGNVFKNTFDNYEYIPLCHINQISNHKNEFGDSSKENRSRAMASTLLIQK